MEEVDVTAEIVKTLPVVIGAALAILGGVAGQIIADNLSRSRERVSLRRERIEALVKALYAHSQWIEDKRTCLLFRGQSHDVPSPLNDAKMLQKLYFPDLAREMLKIYQTEIPILQFIGEQHLARTKDLQSWLNTWNPQPYYDAYAIYLAVLEAAVTKCHDYLTKQIKS